MDRKDLFSLMEAYDTMVLDKELSGDGGSSLNDISSRVSDEMGDMPVSDEMEMKDMSSEISTDEMEENENEKQGMVAAHLHTIRSHAHEISTCIENGANIEPWMQEKIAIANDYIVRVANAIMYRN